MVPAKLHFREAAIGDIQKLCQLRTQMLNEENELSGKLVQTIFENTREYLMQGITNNNVNIYVAEKAGEIIAMGCISYFLLPPNDWCPSGETAYIGNVYTCKKFRRQGIAARILDALLSGAKARKCERVMLHTSGMGKQLYEKLGFKASDSAMVFYPFGLAREQ